MINNSLIFESDILKKYKITKYNLKNFSNYMNDESDDIIMYNNKTTSIEYILFYLNIFIEYSKMIYLLELFAHII